MKHSKCKNWTILVARILLAAIFIVTAYGKLSGIEGTAVYIASFELPYPTFLAWVAGLVELIAGVGLLIGFHARCSAMTLAIYLTIVTLALHFDFGDQNQMIQFLKNAAIIGGLLMVKSCGGGDMCVMKCCCKGKKCDC